MFPTKQCGKNTGIFLLQILPKTDHIIVFKRKNADFFAKNRRK
jgi:hypothetical protein